MYPTYISLCILPDGISAVFQTRERDAGDKDGRRPSESIRTAVIGEEAARQTS